MLPKSMFQKKDKKKGIGTNVKYYSYLEELLKKYESIIKDENLTDNEKVKEILFDMDNIPF